MPKSQPPPPPRHPPVPLDLLEFLERCYPDRAPDPMDTERTIWMKAGQADLVRKLRAVHTRHMDEAMT
jgi:hypothetical protein